MLRVNVVAQLSIVDEATSSCAPIKKIEDVSSLKEGVQLLEKFLGQTTVSPNESAAMPDASAKRHHSDVVRSQIINPYDVLRRFGEGQIDDAETLELLKGYFQQRDRLRVEAEPSSK